MLIGWLTILLYIAVVFVIGTLVFQWLWNITIPELFRLPRLRYWQALRLLIIAGTMFGGGSLVSMTFGR